MPKADLSHVHTDAVRKMIPGLYSLLIREGALPADGVVVVYHDVSRRPEYGLSSSKRGNWAPTGGSGATKKALLEPLRTIDRRYRDRGLMPPNMFIAVDVPNRRAWFSRTFQGTPVGPCLDALTAQTLPEQPTGPPARLATKTQTFKPAHVPALVAELSTPGDSPEEAFLLHQELLQLAVDSLDDDEQLDSLPVHVNAVWVFARSVIMWRPDGSERHVRAVWYRQGEVVWRMRTFAAGIGNTPKEVGERLSGRLPFVPVWDQSRPEQKLLAAVWALMAQGGVTETYREAERGPSTADPDSGDLTVVRVKAGTDHAKVYRSDGPGNMEGRLAWSVRGHWRHQPYRSLGRDSEGRVITKMKWIATYTKGDGGQSAPQEKVIVVRS